MTSELKAEVSEKMYRRSEKVGGNIATGIYVRAKWPDGGWRNADICELDCDSLLSWLRTTPDRAEKVVLALLGHEVS